MTKPLHSAGFTLIELMLSSALILTLLTLAYNGLLTARQAETVINKAVENQTATTAAFDLLNTSFAHNTKITGTPSRVLIELNSADHPWLLNHESLELTLSTRGELLARASKSAENSVLLTGLQSAHFEFISADDLHKHWSEAQPPTAIRFAFLHAGLRRNWLFQVGQQ